MNKDIDDIKDQFRALGMGSVLENPCFMQNPQVHEDSKTKKSFMNDSQVFDNKFDKQEYGNLLKRYQSGASAFNGLNDEIGMDFESVGNQEKLPNA